VAPHVAVASADEAAPDAQDRRDQPVSGWVLQEVSPWPGDQRPQGPRPLTVSECGPLRGARRGQPAERRPAHRSLRWRAGHVPFPVAPHRPSGARNRRCRHVYRPDGAAMWRAT